MSLVFPRRVSESREGAAVSSVALRVPFSIREATVLGVFSGLSSLAFGLWMVFHMGLIQGDAYARVLNAYYVLYGGGFNLAAVGFIWNPLPSILELPFLLFHSLWPPLLDYGVAGNLVSAVFAGISAYYMNRILWRLGIGRAGRIVWTLVFVFNPMIFFYGGNGMSEPMMIGSLLGALDGVIGYVQDTADLKSLIKSGIWLAIGFLIRYEAAPFAFFIGLGALVGLWLQGKKRTELQGMLTVLGLPIAYTGVMWVLANWIIMKNPLYFANSQYSNTAQLGTGSYVTKFTQLSLHHIGQSVLTVIHFALQFPPVILAFVLVALMVVRKRPDPVAFVLLGAAVAVPALQVAMLYKGISGLWARYFIMYIPTGILLVAYLVRIARGNWRWRFWLLSGLTVLLVWGDFQTFQSQLRPDLGHGDRGTFKVIEAGHPVISTVGNFGGAVSVAHILSFKGIAHYINVRPHLIVLADTFVNGEMTPFMKQDSQLVITSDPQFNSDLKNPLGRINAFLVPKPVGVAALDAINYQYPGLWAGHVPWTHLIKQFPGPLQDRLYLVTRNAP